MSADLPDDEVLAAELAFGLLDPDEAATVEARAAAVPALAAAVDRWRGCLAELLDREAIVGAAPDPALWHRIVAATREAAVADAANVVVLRRSVRRWQVAAGGLGALAAALLAVLLVHPQPAARPAPTARPPLVALLDAGGAPSLGAASYDAGSGRLTLHLRHLRTGERVPELWVIGADGKPRSLGIVVTPEDWSQTAPAGASGLLASGATLAVSLEPAGGSPTGQPTGPVVLSGALS